MVTLGRRGHQRSIPTHASRWLGFRHAHATRRSSPALIAVAKAGGEDGSAAASRYGGLRLHVRDVQCLHYGQGRQQAAKERLQAGRLQEGPDCGSARPCKLHRTAGDTDTTGQRQSRPFSHAGVWCKEGLPRLRALDQPGETVPGRSRSAAVHQAGAGGDADCGTQAPPCEDHRTSLEHHAGGGARTMSC